MRHLSVGFLLVTALSSTTALAADSGTGQTPAALSALREELNKDVQQLHAEKVQNSPTPPKKETKIINVTPEQAQLIVDTMKQEAKSEGEANGAPILGPAIEKQGTAQPKATTPAITVPQPPPAVSPPPTQPSPPPAVAAQLSDGTQALFRADGSVSIISPDGRYHKPPDGVLTLRDGTTFSVENGMRTE